MRQDKTYSEVIETSDTAISDVQFLFNKYDEKVKEYNSLMEKYNDEKEQMSGKIKILEKSNEELKTRLAFLACYCKGYSDIEPCDKSLLKRDLRNKLNRIYDEAKSFEDIYRFDEYGRDRLKD